ncbi:MAG: right-handed parallel beta-helix repeat-containing protein [Deltaproteobacteria bacterium]|nr:right-handed parallel beta-helix repeat-containing protein [Deltaproteobacteria bacterium]
MISKACIPGKVRIGIFAALLSVAFLALLQATALGFTLNVVDGNGTPITVGYRWLLEDDPTQPVTPGVVDDNAVSVNIYNGYAPVVAKGTSADTSPLGNPNIVDPSKRYVISVLPDNTYSNGGANVAAGAGTVRVICQALPLPTAQISVQVFEDNAPLNGAPDPPAERGLEGFKIIVFEYAGQVTVDAFGNNLGTTYQFTDLNGNGVHDNGEPFVLDADGNPIVNVQGSGVFTDNTGNAIVKYLAPGKYGVRAVPPEPLNTPPLNEELWIGTSTLEGTPTIDAWVKPNEERLFNEAGFFSTHVFYGFVHPTDNLAWRPLGMYMPFFPIDNTLFPEQYGTISGKVVSFHTTRPPIIPDTAPGVPIQEGWIGVTNLNRADELIYAQPLVTDPLTGDSTFTLTNVPPGAYQLAFWDAPRDVIISFRTVVVPPATPLGPGGGPSTVALDNVPVPMWFGTLKGSIFTDLNRNGYRDAGETGIAGLAINLRFRDGSIYQSTVTDDAGNYELKEIFPFFKWLVVEVDFAVLEATGATVYVDLGGELPRDPARPNTFELTPQPQAEPCADGSTDCRTELSTYTAPILLEAMMVYAGQANVIDWGKTDYPPGKNGGITGVVFYSTTRAEDDAALGVGDPWEPGIPRIVLNLYADANADGVIDDVNGDGVITRADSDNYPFGNFPGPEDIDRNGNGILDYGDAISTVTADSWDDNPITGCIADNAAQTFFQPYGGRYKDCAEIFPYWNQVRPGALFDGGYGFFSYFPGGIDSGSTEVEGLPASTYIVEVVPPPGQYDLVKEEDKNVDFGDSMTPSTRAPEPPNPSTVPPCVGELHTVPAELTLFPGVPAHFAGTDRPLCDLKQVRLAERTNAAADFHLFTEVPKSGRFVGLVTNDITNTFDPASPRFGDKLAPMFLPVGLEDYQGNEIARTYTDQFGGFSVSLPSTYRINAPLPSGVSPSMVTVALNSPGPIESPPGSGNFIRDPFYNPGYSVFRLTFDIMPGKTTHLDTPVLPIGAFTANTGVLDCEFPSGTPVISQVDGPGGGSYVDRAGRIIRLISVQDVSVAGNVRDFGFGDNTGIVTVTPPGGFPIPLEIIAWTDTVITARVPGGISTGQLMVTRGDNGNSTIMGITLHVGGNVRRVYPGQSIQKALDAAAAGDIILVTPGTYDENLIMWKPVKLQGSGAWSTAINGQSFDLDKRAAWDAKVQNLIDSGAIDHIDTLPNDPTQVFNYLQDHGAVVSVFAKDGAFTAADPARIDGLLITGAAGEQGGGGGIFANAYAHHLQISNNKVQSNQGQKIGGIRIGHPSIPDPAGNTPQGPNYVSYRNDNVVIHHNHVDQNGGVFEPAAGGGIGLFNGSDEYRITENWICGNFSLVYGAGISHFGLSNNGLIENNRILFNEAFDEGGGIIVSGELVPVGADPNRLTPGSGNVTINRNLIQGNLAQDDGAGIRLLLVNGQDVLRNPADNTAWYRVDILNNIIVNNLSGDSGAGISLDDAANVAIVNNTIAYNDSTSTFEDAFGAACLPFPAAAGLCTPGATGGGLNITTPQAAGISALAHSSQLQAAFDPSQAQTFANPILYNNILWHNRSFYWDATLNNGSGGLLPAVDNAGLGGFYWNVGVFGGIGTEKLDARNCILDGNSGPTVLNPAANMIVSSDNNAAFPRFADPYFNTPFPLPGTFGFVTVTFTQPGQTSLGLKGDYHINGPNPPTDNTYSQAIDAGAALGTIPAGAQTITNLGVDIDGEARPFDEPLAADSPSPVDIGADEFRRIVLP